MKNEILFIEKNTPELRNELLNFGLTHSKYCNEGIYLSVENGMILQLNHKPYEKHRVFDSEKEFLQYVSLIST